MKKNEIILLAMNAEPNYEYTPVQIQKILFLIDKNIGEKIGGPLFDFIAYYYGPFDSNIYDELEKLEMGNKIKSIANNRTRKKFVLTPNGLEEAIKIKNETTEDIKQYIDKIVKWAINLSFSQLLSAIYHTYPEMKANSIFKD